MTTPKVSPRDDQAKTEEKEMTADSVWVNDRGDRNPGDLQPIERRDQFRRDKAGIQK